MTNEGRVEAQTRQRLSSRWTWKTKQLDLNIKSWKLTHAQSTDVETSLYVFTVQFWLMYIYAYIQGQTLVWWRQVFTSCSRGKWEKPHVIPGRVKLPWDCKEFNWKFQFDQFDQNALSLPLWPRQMRLNGLQAISLCTYPLAKECSSVSTLANQLAFG